MRKIIGLGEVLWDIYYPSGERHFGGAPANFALHAAQLGGEGIIVSRVGEDELGREILRMIEQKGASTQYIQVDPKRKTGTVQVRLDEKGVPSFQITPDVAYDYLELDQNLVSLAKEADAILFGTLAQRNLKSRETIHTFLNMSEKAVKIYDINLRGWGRDTLKIVERSLRVADVLKLNEDELGELKERFQSQSTGDLEFMEMLMKDFDLKMICLTLGEKGCFLMDEKDKVYSPGVLIDPVVDTTGSGDAFVAAFVVKYLQRSPLKEIADYSNYVGAYVATQKGAVPFYDRSRLDEFIQSHKERNFIDKF